MATLFRSTCDGHGETQRLLADPNLNPGLVFDDRLLIIEFNFPGHYESVPYLEGLYRPSFPNILYCTTTPLKSEVAYFDLFKMETFVDSIGEHEDWKVRKVRLEVSMETEPFALLRYDLDYVIHDSGKGLPGYMSETPNYCMEAAIIRFPSYKGYVYIADDTIFHFWNVVNFDADRFWWYNTHPLYQYDILTQRSVECQENINGTLKNCKPYKWTWYKDFRDEIDMSFRLLSRHSTLSQKCLAELKQKNGGRLAVNRGQTDFYYVPQKRALDFLHLSNLFRSARLWHEISLPIIIYCLNRPEELQISSQYHNWNFSTNRRRPWEWYEGHLNATSVHPAKLGALAYRNRNYTQFFCDVVFPNAIRHVFSPKSALKVKLP